MGDSFTVDDLAANGLLGDDYPQTCWERSVETLIARKDEITGLAIASDERLEAYLLYIKDEIVALRTLVEDDGARLTQLLGRLDAAGNGAFRIPKVHPAEISKDAWRPSGSASPAVTCSTEPRRGPSRLTSHGRPQCLTSSATSRTFRSSPSVAAFAV